ncbi:MAG: hypothetical protein IT357_06235 [Gemmatimonadaceae bacterium]|nr:hypothetical protein [Gemmatimonadaceae bacterium]
MTDHMTPAPDDWADDLDDELPADLADRAADLELIVEALNGHLSPERVAEVTRRLDEDPAFREFAAPMLLTWSVPSYLERHPRPVGELENAWNEFAERAGITQPPVQKGWSKHPLWRRIRYPLVALLVVGISMLVWFNAPKFDKVPYRTGWIPLGDSIFVELTADASLRTARELVRGVRHARLSGSARFRGVALDSLAGEPRTTGLLLHTRGGIVSAGEGEYTVTARGDTTLVEVHRPSQRRFFYFVPLPTAVVVKSDTNASPFVLRELERGRLVRDRAPERLPALPTTPTRPARP